MKRKYPITQNQSETLNKMNELPRANSPKFEIASWNVEEKGSPEEIDKILLETLKEKRDVICLQRATLPDPLTGTDNYKWLCSGNTGSAILIKKTSNLISNSFERFSDHICMAELTGKGDFKVKVVSCYIPPVTDYTCAETWKLLREIIGNIPHLLYILAGDFNAQLGKNDASLPPETKKGLYHESNNENGKTLSNLMTKCHLRLYIPDKKESNEFFTFNDGTLKCQQSYILVSKLRQSFAGDVKTVWHSNYNHALICYRVFCKLGDILLNESEVNLENNPLSGISCWNIQNATPAKVDSVVTESRLPIVCIQELFLTSDEDILTDNYTWYCTKKMWAKNVGILIKKSPDIVVSHFESISEYLCVANVLFYGKPLTVISLHLPAVTDPQYEQVISTTKEQIKSIPEESFTVLGGDFSSAKTEDFNNADEFVDNFAKENKMVWTTKRKGKLLTHTTENGKYRVNYILLSESVYKLFLINLNFRWIPFFEHPIISVVATGKYKMQFKLSFENMKLLDRPRLSVHKETKNNTNIKIVTYNYDLQKGVVPLDDMSSSVSEEDREKFKTSVPSAEDLAKIFKDFVIIQASSRQSNLILTPFGILAKSLIDCRVGGFSVENITETHAKNTKIICRIVWNGILLAEEIDKPKQRQKHQNLTLKRAAKSVLAKLSQTCYTVKAKKSYFNDGLQPKFMDDPALAATLKKVDKSLFSTMEDVYKHIDEFTSEDTDAELIFGPDFSKNEKFDLARYAYNKVGLLDFRFYKSKDDNSEPDFLALFRKRSPQYFRDILIKEPKNFKYYLIPPCGLGVDYVEFNTKVVAKMIKEEYSRYKPQSKTQNQSDSKPVKKLDGPKGKESLNKKRPMDNGRSRLSGRVSSITRNLHTQQNKRGRDVKIQKSPWQNARTQPSRRERIINKNLRQNTRSKPFDRGHATRRSHSYDTLRSQYLDVVSSVHGGHKRNHSPEYSRGRKRDYDAMDTSLNRPFGSDQYQLFESNLYLERSGEYRPIDSIQKVSYESNQYFETSGREREYGRQGSSQKDFYNSDQQYETSGREHEYGRQGSSQQDFYNRDQLYETSGREHEYGRQGSSQKDFYNRDQLYETSGREHEYGRQGSSQKDFYNRDQQYETSGNEHEYGRQGSSQKDFYNSDQQYETSGREHEYGRQGSSQKDFYNRDQQYETSVFSKRQKRGSSNNDTGGILVEIPDWRTIRPLVIVWPISVYSQVEDRPEVVLSDNFNVEYKTRNLNNQVDTAVYVTLTHYDGTIRSYCIAKGRTSRDAARIAVELLENHCTVIKPKSTFLCNGHIPNFIRYKIPCTLNPHSYVIIDKGYTGPLSVRTLEDLIERFIKNHLQEMYFDRDSYSLDEKLLIIQDVPKLTQQKLLVRHFGDSPKLIDRYICIYKQKAKGTILQEVLEMKDDHPRYTMIVNRLPLIY